MKKKGLHYGKLWHLVWGGKEEYKQVGFREPKYSPMPPKDTEPNMIYDGQRGHNSCCTSLRKPVAAEPFNTFKFQ